MVRAMRGRLRTSHHSWTVLQGAYGVCNVDHLQGLAYELARDLISSRIGRLSSLIGLEERKAAPSEQRISALEQRIIAFARLREELDPRDEDGVRSVIVRYSRSRRFPEQLSGYGRVGKGSQTKR